MIVLRLILCIIYVFYNAKVHLKTLVKDQTAKHWISWQSHVLFKFDIRSVAARGYQIPVHKLFASNYNPLFQPFKFTALFRDYVQYWFFKSLDLGLYRTAVDLTTYHQMARMFKWYIRIYMYSEDIE